MQAIIPKEKRTVFTASGKSELGFVSDDIAQKLGLSAGPIKLLNGVEGAKTGFGLAHIENHSQRLKQIAGMGFKDVVAYVLYVASGYEKIVLQDDGRLLFIRYGHGLFHQVICQWDPELSAWSVTTAFPKGAIRNLNIVWEKE